MQCVEGKSEWKKTAYGAKRIPKQKTISNSNSVSILGITENATFAHFMKKSMHLKTGFLIDYQVLFLLPNGPQIEKSLQCRFMTSEGTDTLILPFTSKTGQSVAQNFIFGFY